jgi:hypothetical protein
MDMPRFHLINPLTVVMLLVTCNPSAWSEDFFREEAAVRFQQVQIERLENARLIAENAEREAKLPVVKPVMRGNVLVRDLVHHIDHVVHHIDHVVYGTSVIYGQQLIENQLKNKLQQLSSEYDLTEAQQSKLLLAGQWEAKQFSNEVDALRQKYVSLEGNVSGQQLIVKQAQFLQRKRQTLFAHGSFTSKVMNRTVTGEQLSKYQAVLDDRLRLRHRSNIEGAIRDIERQVVLHIAQHEALVDLLLSETQPLKSPDDYDETVVKYHLSLISEQKLKPVFDEGQWPQIRQILDGFQEFETTLLQRGLIDEVAVEKRNQAMNSHSQQKKP